MRYSASGERLPPMMENQNGDAGLFILPPVSLEG
jgi:hypothetical protein